MLTLSLYNNSRLRKKLFNFISNIKSAVIKEILPEKLHENEFSRSLSRKYVNIPDIDTKKTSTKIARVKEIHRKSFLIFWISVKSWKSETNEIRESRALYCSNIEFHGWEEFPWSNYHIKIPHRPVWCDRRRALVDVLFDWWPSRATCRNPIPSWVCKRRSRMCQPWRYDSRLRRYSQRNCWRSSGIEPQAGLRPLGKICLPFLVSPLHEPSSDSVCRWARLEFKIWIVSVLFYASIPGLWSNFSRKGSRFPLILFYDSIETSYATILFNN